MPPRNDLVFKGDAPSNQEAINRSVKPVLMTDMDNGAERS